MKSVKAADEEIADETIKEARVVTEQDAEAVAEGMPGSLVMNVRSDDDDSTRVFWRISHRSL